MKKIFASMLCALLLFAGTGCSADGAVSRTESTAASQPGAAATKTTPSSEALAPKASSESDAEKSAEPKTVVIYFSGTGNTAAIAQTMAEILDAPLFEITPAEPYTSDDLNYSNDNCRANREQSEDSARPEITGDLSEAENCETIYLGYPVWWGTNPKIIETFLDTYDLSAATVYTFCTSGSSGIETSVSHLQKQYPDINIVSGHRFPAGAAGSEITGWLNGSK